MTEQNEARHPLEQLAQKTESIQDKDSCKEESSPDSRGLNFKGFSQDPKLSLNGIQGPALLIDRKLRVVWQNQAARMQIWHKSSANNNGSTYPNVFDLIFDPGFQQKVDNWRQWADFFMQHARGLANQDVLDRLIERRSERQLDVMKAILSESGSFPDGQPAMHMMQQVMADGAVESFSVMTADFNEGRLIMFNTLQNTATGKDRARTAAIEQGLKIIRQQPQPAKIPLYVMAVCLNNAHVLQAEMLDDDYTLLLGRIWRTCIETIERFGGIIGHHSRNRLFACFSPVLTNEEYPAQIISCALELKGQMVEIGREWKIRKGWLHEIELNIGLHGGEDHVGMMQSCLAESLLSYGNTMEIAGQLARIAQKGQIFASKPIISQLPQHELRFLRFGVFRQENQRQIYIANCFSRIKDLAWFAESSLPAGTQIRELSVTQIFDRNVQEIG